MVSDFCLCMENAQFFLAEYFKTIGKAEIISFKKQSEILVLYRDTFATQWFFQVLIQRT